MLILTLRTDKPEAELGLFSDGGQVAYLTWQAHRELAETIHLKIKELLAAQDCTLQQLEGVAVYKGPGSFTGLRIGLSVANALAYGLKIPVAARGGTDWIQAATTALEAGEDEKITLPEYGIPPHITRQKK